MSFLTCSRWALLSLVLSAAWLFPLAVWGDSICDIPGNLVVNCGFESGDFTGWTLGSNWNNNYVDSYAAHSGNYGADLWQIGSEFGGSDTTLSQFVGGNSNMYFVSFWLRNPSGGTNDFTVFWNGVDVGPHVVDAPNFEWHLFFGWVNGNAGAGSNSLEFVFSQVVGHQWQLDDVAVQVVQGPNVSRTGQPNIARHRTCGLGWRSAP